MRSTLLHLAVLLLSAFSGNFQGFVDARDLHASNNSQQGQEDSLPHRVIQSDFGTVEAGKLVPAGDATTKVDPDWIHGFSALRDPERQEVRFFFDAYPDKADAIHTVFFMRTAANADLSDAANISGCNLQRISDPQGVADHDTVEGLHRFLEGWQLTCRDPGKEFEAAVFLYDRVKYTAFSIEKIATEREGKVAACVAPLYTARLFTHPWLVYNANLGVERFFLYRALVSDFSAGEYSMGIWSSPELSQHAAVKMFRRKGLQWFTYQAPPFRYMHGQTTALNDCLVRNRYTFEYLAIVDVDEIIRIKGGSRNLAAFLDEHFPRDASNMVVPRFTFPVQCCDHNLDEAAAEDDVLSLRFFESCRKYTAKDHDYGKTIVRPDLVEGLNQHTVMYHRPGAEKRVSLEPWDAHLVHIRRAAAWGLPMECSATAEGF